MRDMIATNLPIIGTLIRIGVSAYRGEYCRAAGNTVLLACDAAAIYTMLYKASLSPFVALSGASVGDLLFSSLYCRTHTCDSCQADPADLAAWNGGPYTAVEADDGDREISMQRN